MKVPNQGEICALRQDEVQVPDPLRQATRRVIHDNRYGALIQNLKWTCSDIIRQWRIPNLLWRIYIFDQSIRRVTVTSA